jgi:alpha-galactosidase
MINISTGAQPFAKWDKDILYLNNGLVERIIKLPQEPTGTITTSSIILSNIQKNFVEEINGEFYFEADKRPVDGKTGWNLIRVFPVSDENGGNGAVVQLKGSKITNHEIEVNITYMLYPGSPVIRKKIGFMNDGMYDICLESLDVESLVSTLDMTYTWIYNNYGRYKTMNGYTGNYYDPVIILHQVTADLGIVIGNEAPGVLKKTVAMTDGHSFRIGMNHSSDDYPFRKWLSPGKYWESPYTFVAPYTNTPNPDEVLNTTINDFVRKNMGIRLTKIEKLPTSVYNTWAPFRGNMTTSTVIDVAQNAANCGFKYFVMDAGWNTIDGKPTLTGDNDIDWILNLGDWKEDFSKFPNGLKEVFNEVQRLGMKPGLWISIATATMNARVYREHPDWFVNDENGEPAFLHNEKGHPNQVTACLGSGYYDYIKKTILGLVKNLGLKYIKLDLSVVTSAYRYNPRYTGCSAKNHSHHRDREESYFAIYERCWQLFDELHQEFPDLYIDCTFETMGKLQLIDFAMLQHAEGNWMTNIDETSPKGGWRVRQMAWWRTPVIPASSLVIGNMILDEPNYFLSLLSNSGSMPILLGDTRKLSSVEQSKIRQWTDWIEQAEVRHNIMLYRQDLPGFGEPQDGAWDGFQRINTDSKSGGIVGVFRQGAEEDVRTVTVRYLGIKNMYRVLSFPEEKTIATLSGNDLAEKGFIVKINNKYDGALFEIREVQ